MSRVIGFELSSQDPKKAMEFYSKVFGWGFAEPQWDFWPVMIEESLHPGINGGISKGPIDFPHGTRIKIEVGSIDEVVASAIENGAMIVREKMEFDAFYLAYLTDPTGIGFGLIQKK